jgi:hypothetical protein
MDFIRTILNNIYSVVNNIYTKVNGLSSVAVKSVQRGVTSVVKSGATTITISSVTPSKCQVTLHGSGHVSNGTAYAYTVLPYVSSCNSTSLLVAWSSSVDVGGNVSWEVAEFY